MTTTFNQSGEPRAPHNQGRYKMHLSEQERKEIKIETILGLVDENGTEFSARAALISCLNWMDSHEISQMLRTTNLRTGEPK